MATRFRKRPPTIEAVQWNGSNLQEVWDFIGASAATYPVAEFSSPAWDGNWKYLKKVMLATVGEWVVKDANGDLSQLKPDVFLATYEVDK